MDDGQLIIGGRTFKTRALNHSLRSEMETEVARLKSEHWVKTTPMLINLAAELTEPAIRYLIEALVDRTEFSRVTATDLREYIEGPAGVAHVFWGLVRDHQREEFPDLAAAKAFVDSLPILELQGAIDDSQKVAAKPAPDLAAPTATANVAEQS